MLPRRIVSWGALALLTAALLAAPAAAQEPSGVTVKRDGDNVVLIPRDKGKAYLVLGIPREKISHKPAAGPAGSLIYLAGEQKLSAKDLQKVYILEIGPVIEVDLQAAKPGSQLWPQNPCKDMTCVMPMPRCPPACPTASLLFGDPAALASPQPQGKP